MENNDSGGFNLPMPPISNIPANVKIEGGFINVTQPNQ
jgi:hypothetical protein